MTDVKRSPLTAGPTLLGQFDIGAVCLVTLLALASRLTGYQTVRADNTGVHAPSQS